MPSNISNLPKLNGISKASELPSITNIPVLQQAKIFVLAEQTPGTKTFGLFPADSFSDLVFADPRFSALLDLVNTSGVEIDVDGLIASIDSDITIVSTSGTRIDLIALKGQSLPSCIVEWSTNNKTLTDITLTVDNHGSTNLEDGATSVNISTYVNRYSAYNQDSATVRITGMADDTLPFTLVINIEFKLRVYFGMSRNKTLSDSTIEGSNNYRFYDANSLVSRRWYVKQSGTGVYYPYVSIPRDAEATTERLNNCVLLVNNVVVNHTLNQTTEFNTFYSNQAILGTDSGVLIELINPNEE